MAMIMPVMMIVLQDERADQIDAKPDAGDQQRIAIGDRARGEQALDGFHGHRQRR